MRASNENGHFKPSYVAHVWRGNQHHLDPVWKKLSDRKDSATAIYQSPSYFKFLEDTEGSRNLELLTVQARSTRDVVGVAPVQRLTLDIPFSIGRHTLFKSCLRCLRILGSKPIIPETGEAYDQLFSLISEQYPELSVQLEAVRVDSFFWEYLFSSKLIRDTYFAHILHGVQECHFIHLPSSIEEYRRRLGRKQAHNLERQQRVLERHLGAPLTITPVGSKDQIPMVIDAMRTLGEPGCNDEAMKDRITAAVRMGFYCGFVVKANTRVLGVTWGRKSNSIFGVHRILYDKELEKFSPGTTMWQLVLRHLIETRNFKSVDLGYGTPTYSHRSLNTIHKRGKVLLFRKTLANRFLINAHASFTALVHLSKQALSPESQLKQRSLTTH